MCKVIVVGNDESSTKSRLAKKLASMGVEIVSSVSWANLHQADPKDAELLVFNACGLPGKLNDVSARARNWGLSVVQVFASKHEVKLDELLRWQGARAERKRSPAFFGTSPVPREVIEAHASAPPPEPPKGPPCVACGKPVTKVTRGRNGGGWAKTCGDPACLRETRLAGAKKGLATFMANRAKPEAPPVEVVAEVETPEPGTIPTQPPSSAIVVAGWHLEQFPDDPEPRILDVTLAERLGYKNPDDVRELCERLFKAGKIAPHVRESQTPTGGKRTYTSTAYYLDERNTLRVIRRCETDKADEVMDEVIAVYLAVRHGEKPQQPTALTARDQLRLLLQSQDELEARVNGKVGELGTHLRNQLAGIESFTSNLESEQERIEREAKEGIANTQNEIATLRKKQEEIEDALTRPRGPVQTTIVNTRVIGDNGAVEIFDAIKAMAVSAARERMREDWDSLDWVALCLWCDSFIYARSREVVGITGSSASLTFSQADAWRATLTEDLRRETIAWTRERRIPNSYHKRAKAYRHKPIQQKNNVIKLVKPEEGKAS